VRTFLWLFFALFLLSGCAARAALDGTSPTPTAPSKPLYQVERGTVRDERHFVGRIAPGTSEAFGFAVDGRVQAVFVEAGADVAAGDTLARLDTRALEQELLAAEEELASASSILEGAARRQRYESQRAQLQLDRAQLGLDHRRASLADAPAGEGTLDTQLLRIERDLARLALDALETDPDPQLRFAVTRAEKRVDSLNANIAAAVLAAPITGRLLRMDLAPGAAVTAHEPIAILADLTELEIRSELDADDLFELSVGMSLRIQPVAAGAGDTDIGGVIASLPAPYGLASDGFVHIAFDTQPPPGSFQLGDRVHYTVLLAMRDEVLWLPVAAVRRSDGRDVIVVQDDGRQQERDVRLGLQGGGRVEILAGAEAGQRVIAP